MGDETEARSKTDIKTTWKELQQFLVEIIWFLTGQQILPLFNKRLFVLTQDQMTNHNVSRVLEINIFIWPWFVTLTLCIQANIWDVVVTISLLNPVNSDCVETQTLTSHLNDKWIGNSHKFTFVFCQYSENPLKFVTNLDGNLTISVTGGKD